MRTAMEIDAPAVMRALDRLFADTPTLSSGRMSAADLVHLDKATVLQPSVLAPHIASGASQFSSRETWFAVDAVVAAIDNIGDAVNKGRRARFADRGRG